MSIYLSVCLSISLSLSLSIYIYIYREREIVGSAAIPDHDQTVRVVLDPV